MQTTAKENASFECFKALCMDAIGDECCQFSEERTRAQKDSPMWHHLRFGQITASRLYEVAQCHTPDGSLVESILGATKFKGTRAMKRGNELEQKVLESVGTRLGEKCAAAGLYVVRELPIFGASPDAVLRGSDGQVSAVVEVKCPASQATVPSYVNSGGIAPKCRAQMQL